MYMYEVDFDAENINEECFKEVLEEVINRQDDDAKPVWEAVLENCNCGAFQSETLSILSEIVAIYSSPCGMQGGFANMVWYSQTSEFFDKYPVTDFLHQLDQEFGDNYLANKFGQLWFEDGEERAKNFATWAVFEYIAREIAETEVDENLVYAE